MAKTMLRGLLAGLLALLPLFAWAQAAGRVILSVGEVTALRGTASVNLAFNAPVFPGDTIRLGPNSNAQIRLTDQSIIGLRERSQFRIDEYQFSQGDGRSIFTLLAGGMRTVTGAIGRLQKRENYAVRTPTSTIGIRGTHFTIVHCNNDCGNPGSASALLASASMGTVSDVGPLAQAPGGAGSPIANGTYGGVTDGRINATPLQAPDLGKDFGHDEYFHVASPTSAPQSLIAPPSFLHDRLAGQNRTKGQQGKESGETLAQGGINSESRPSSVPAGPAPSSFIVTEQKTSTGGTTVVPSSVATHGGLGAWRDAQGNASVGGAFFNSSMITFSGNIVTAFNVPAGTQTTGNDNSAVSGTFAGSALEWQKGSVVDIYIGRWTGGTVTENTGTVDLAANGGAHFVYGPLTPPDVISSKSGSFSFSSVMTTTPTHSGGLSYSSGGFPGTLTVNFTNQTVTIPGSSITFATPQTWSLPGATAPIKIVSGVGASFEVANVVGGSCGGGGCGGTVKFSASGIFMGPAGSQHLGVTLGASNNLTQTIQGAKVYFCSGC